MHYSTCRPLVWQEASFQDTFYSAYFWILYQKSVSIHLWIHVLELNWNPLIFLFDFMPIPSDLCYCSSEAQFIIWCGEIPGVLLLFMIVLAIWHLFVFPYVVENCPFEICEEFCCHFSVDCIEFEGCFWLGGHIYYVYNIIS